MRRGPNELARMIQIENLLGNAAGNCCSTIRSLERRTNWLQCGRSRSKTKRQLAAEQIPANNLLPTLILERNLDLCAVGLDFAIVQLHVELDNFRNAQISERFAGALDGGLGRIFPRLSARSDQLYDLVNAVNHGRLLANICLPRDSSLIVPQNYQSRHLDMVPACRPRKDFHLERS